MSYEHRRVLTRNLGGVQSRMSMRTTKHYKARRDGNPRASDSIVL